MQRAFDIELGTLLHILLDNLAKAFVEDDDRVPFGLFLALTGIAIAPGFRRRDAKVGDRTAVLGPTDFRICTHVADQNDLVDATCHNLLTLLCRHRGLNPIRSP
ncbi:hypothetical protein D3C73_1015870 [compost metagenome]